MTIRKSSGQADPVSEQDDGPDDCQRSFPRDFMFPAEM